MVASVVPGASPLVRVSPARADEQLAELSEVLDDVTAALPQRIIVDLSSVNQIDSSNVATLLRAYHFQRVHGGEMTLVIGDRLAVRAIVAMMMGGLPSLRLVDSLRAALHSAPSDSDPPIARAA